MSQEEKFPHVRMSNGRVRQPLRIGRVERDVALKVLEEAYVEERLTLVEYDERMGKVFSATTREELDFIVEDLTTECLTFPPPKLAQPPQSQVGKGSTSKSVKPVPKPHPRPPSTTRSHLTSAPPRPHVRTSLPPPSNTRSHLTPAPLRVHVRLKMKHMI